MSFKSEEIVEFVQQHFKSVADPEKAKQMAAYMKTDMPFYGVQKPLRRPLNRAIKRRFPASSQQVYKRTVMLLWRLPHREEKYTAIEYARINAQFIEPKSLPLYEQLIREGAWWDLVDSVASDLVGLVLLNFRSTTRQLMETWIEDSDLWIRRTAILSQLRHKQQTELRHGSLT